MIKINRVEKIAILLLAALLLNLNLPWPGGPAAVYAADAACDDASGGPWITITTATELYDIRNDVAAHYKLGGNIDLSDYADDDAGQGWLPIGDSLAPFIGIFDGAGYEITGLVVNRAQSEPMGLFGRIGAGGIVRNVVLSGGSVTGISRVGALAGYNAGLIANVSVTTSVYGVNPFGGNDRIGGLAGTLNEGGKIACSRASGNVTGDDEIGGLAGKVENGEIVDSFASGKVEGWYSVGGLAGYVDKDGIVSGSHATGDVNGFQNIGGLAGQHYGSINRSYATGAVVGTSDLVGGLVGYLGDMASIDRSYATGPVTGANNVGGLAGDSSMGIITSSYAAGAVNGVHGIGGLVGNAYSGTTIARSYASGAVTGDSALGGLIGYSGDGDISNSYAVGAVTGAADFVGGLAGFLENGSIATSYAAGAVNGAADVGGLVGFNHDGTVSDSFYDRETTGQSDDSGKGTPKPTTDMKTGATFIGAGWDFAAIWGIHAVRNTGYPYLVPPYVVSYDGNGNDGGNSPAAVLYEAGDPVVVPGNTGSLEQDGHTFSGWNTAADGSGDAYASGDSFTMGTANVTLFAQWTEAIAPVDSGGDDSGDEEEPVRNARLIEDSAVVGLAPIGMIDRPGQAAFEQVDLGAKKLGEALSLLQHKLSPVLTVEIDDTARLVQVRMAADAVGAAARQMPDTVIEIRLNTVSYELPLRALDLEAWADRLGTTLDQMQVSVALERADAAAEDEIGRQAAAAGFQVDGAILSFRVTMDANGQSEEMADFGTTYITRGIVTEGDTAGKILTGVLYDSAEKTFYFVPSFTGARPDGTEQFVLKAPHNSVYTVLGSDGKSFDDLPGHWAQADVELLASKLIIAGISDRLYAPDRNITRAEFTALLVRSLGFAAQSDGATPFVDVYAHAWYAPVVATAAKIGIVHGIDPTHFAPYEKITREQMAVMIAGAIRVAGGLDVDTDAGVSLARFTDRASVAAWAEQAVAECVAAGIIRGFPDRTIGPQRLATRAEAAVMMKQFLQAVGFID